MHVIIFSIQEMKQTLSLKCNVLNSTIKYKITVK